MRLLFVKSENGGFSMAKSMTIKGGKTVQVIEGTNQVTEPPYQQVCERHGTLFAGNIEPNGWCQECGIPQERLEAVRREARNSKLRFPRMKVRQT